MNCRSCGEFLKAEILDLGYAPPSNAYLLESQLSEAETHLPLRVLVCENCWLVQTADFIAADELFTGTYAYLSSTSKSWLKHAQSYSLEVMAKLELGSQSFVVEVASNDGYLLQYFLEANVPCLGIEPTRGTAEIAREKGIETICDFFGKQLASDVAGKYRKADLIIGNNVFAHVPDLNDFTSGLANLLAPGGTITLEFPHLMQLIRFAQFDTVYHEHFSYLSVGSIRELFARHGLEIYDIKELETHGGSLRIFVGFIDEHNISESVQRIIQQEADAGLFNLESLRSLNTNAVNAKHELLRFLLEAKSLGKSVMGIGAAAKGNTFLNFAGISSDLLPVVVDGASFKQGKFLPGSHIPVISPEELTGRHVDIGIIFPWNIEKELKSQYQTLLGPEVEIICSNAFLGMLHQK